jgi:hypothetical protein
MLSTSTKRRRKTAAITAASNSDVNVVVLRLTDLPIGLFQHVSSYLPTTTQALFSVAAQEHENISSIIISSNERSSSWDTLDFGDIEKDLAAKLSDDDISAILLRIDAINNLKTLKLTNCINISGIGLEPLRRSLIIEQIDLSLTGEHQSPVLMVVLELVFAN